MEYGVGDWHAGWSQHAFQWRFSLNVFSDSAPLGGQACATVIRVSAPLGGRWDLKLPPLTRCPDSTAYPRTLPSAFAFTLDLAIASTGVRPHGSTEKITSIYSTASWR